jgi:hypothetical protein
LLLGSGHDPALALFPIMSRPLAAAVSEAGDQALIVDVTGGLHLRGTSGEDALPRRIHSSDVRAAALDTSTLVVVGGTANRPGWLEIHDLTSAASPSRVPLDEAAVDVVLHGDRMLIARASGLLSMRCAGHSRGLNVQYSGDSHE